MLVNIFQIGVGYSESNYSSRQGQQQDQAQTIGIDLNIQKITKIIESTKKFSELTPDDADLVCQHFNVSQSDMKLLEVDGWGLLKSLSITNVMAKYNFTLNEAEKLFSTHTDSMALMKELLVFNHLIEIYNPAEVERKEIRARLSSGEEMNVINDEYVENKLKDEKN
jgi:hypothetical protein